MYREKKDQEIENFQIKEYIYREYELNPEFPVMALVKENFDFLLEPETITWLHFHNCMEIMYCYEERVVNIENRFYFLEPGSICVIPPNQMHNSKAETFYKNDPEMPRCEYLYLNPEKLLKDFFTETYSFSSVFEQINRDLKNVISPKDNPVIVRLFLLLLEEMRVPDFNRNMVKGLFLSFWIELLRTLKLPKVGGMAKRRELTEIYPAMVYAREHSAERISSEILAKVCHMSLSQFRKNFKTVLGSSPGKYIENIRLSRSCELLLETETGILEIALRCGFTSLSAYNRRFKAKYGVTPSRWRRERRKIKKNTYSHSVYKQENGKKSRKESP